jgi:SAM-dependent methyltransferase
LSPEVKAPDEGRVESFGQRSKITPVDRFGVWLSARQIHRWVPTLKDKRVGDFGCGYDASFARTILGTASKVTLIDVALREDLLAHPKVQAFTEPLGDALVKVPDASLDVIVCISVLEHLWEPQRAIAECFRILAPGGTCLLNVPSWRGKRYLEFSAFKLKLSPEIEMNDHKMYYDVKEFWPLIVRAGFRPSDIQCFPHKFGLNTFAVCRKPPS